jgi:signal transduction histidine kinase
VLTHLEVISRQRKRISDLIDHPMDLTRIFAGQVRLELETVDLTTLVSEMVSRCGPITGTWDRARLEQVVSHLLSNAIQYGAGKPIRVWVEPVGERARLTVKDEGPGIEPGEQSRIFEKRERAPAGAMRRNGLPQAPEGLIGRRLRPGEHVLSPHQRADSSFRRIAASA